MPMPRFYFHLRGPAGLDRDEIGLNLDGLEAAYLDACASVPALSFEMLQQRVSPDQHTFEIMDAVGTLLMEVPFAEVLERGRKPVRPHQRADFSEASAEIARARRLIAELQDERQALRDTLTETKRLLAEARKAGGAAP